MEAGTMSALASGEGSGGLGSGRLRVVRIALLVAAVAELVVGLLHFAMPSLVLGRSEFASLPPAAHDFVTLCVVAVGLLLVGMAALAVVAAAAADSSPGLGAAIALVQASLWFVRAGLEIPWPLREPLLFLPEPSLVVIVGSLCLASLLALAGLGLARTTRRRS
jgi:hypothetical protein